VPDFNEKLIKNGLNTRVIGREVLYYPSLPSTMDTAREKARQGAAEGTVIIAGEQTAGRGRLKRAWLAPAGNIALSAILRPETAALPYLIMIASLAVARSIERVTGLTTQIKWPNDVLTEGKKVCGILIENELKGNKIEFSIIGIGINTNLRVNDFSEIKDTAASLQNTPGGDLRLKLTQALLRELDLIYVNLDTKHIFEQWRKRLVTLGKKVKATSGVQVIEGVAEDVDAEGALWLRQAGGGLFKVVAGDVTLKG
jgi:BirA family transcriptional regulator, biotin operon repressor / biotin---[acetyl-CoA-carboxylase] ligase